MIRPTAEQFATIDPRTAHVTYQIIDYVAGLGVPQTRQWAALLLAARCAHGGGNAEWVEALATLVRAYTEVV